MSQQITHFVVKKKEKKNRKKKQRQCMVIYELKNYINFEDIVIR